MKIASYFSLVLLYTLILGSCVKHSVHAQIHVPKNSEAESLIRDEEITKKKQSELPILFSLNGLHGYVDRKLQVIIPPVYNTADHFNKNGYAAVRHKGKEGRWECMILDVAGEVLFHEYASRIRILYDTLITHGSTGGFCKVVNFRNKNVLADRLGTMAESTEDGIILATYRRGNERVFLNSSGERILSNLKLNRITNTFREQRAIITDGNYDMHIIDTEGNIYGDLDFYCVGGYFSEGLFPVQTKDGRTGYINRNGEFEFNVPFIPDVPNYQLARLMATNFKDGYAMIQTVVDPPTWLIINKQGQSVADELVLLDAEDFSEGLSRVRTTEKKYGYLNTQGKMVIDAIFEEAHSFHDGYARIIYEGRDGLINTEGKIFWSDEIVNTTSTGMTQEGNS